jgi:TolA-binding protein
MGWQAIPGFCNFTPSPPTTYPMTQRVHNLKSLLCIAILTAGCGHLAMAQGQAQGAAAAQQALELLNEGKLPEAEDAYNALITQFPTSGVAPEALFRLGYVQYLLAEYPRAIATLQRVTSPPATPEIKAAADALIPEAYNAEASAMEPGDPGRKQAFQDAIKQFEAYIQKYPQSAQVESAMYGRAAALFQIQDYTNASTGLTQILQRFPNSDTTLDTEDLLALVLTSQASDILRNKGDASVAAQKYNQALTYLADIIERNADVSLSNSAQFQIGEVLFNRGNAEKDPARTKDFTNAMAAYRAVQPPAALVPAQEARVAFVLQRVRQASASNDASALERVQRVQDRENAKLQSLKHAPDQTLNAQLRIASIFFFLQKFDEARVLLRYLQPFAIDPDQKKQLQYYITLTYISQGILDKAEQAYNAFFSAYRGDPLGENLPLVMGSAFLSGTNSQPQKAAAYLAQEREYYPGSPLVNDALDQQAAALSGQHRYDEAIATYNQFLAQNPPPEQAADASRGIATIYQQTGKMDEAVKQYQATADKYPTTAAAEQCAFYAAGLETSVNAAQALPMLQTFVRKHPNGQYTAQAMMMIGQVQNSTGSTDAALQTFKDVEAKFPKSEFAPQAYFQQAATLARQDKTDEMVSVLQEFLSKYPDDKDVFYAYDTIGQTQAGKGKVADAIATYGDMVKSHPEHPMAPLAVYRETELWHRVAESMGRYQALKPDAQPTWEKAVRSSIAAGEQLAQNYPNAPQVGVALKMIRTDHEMLVAAGKETTDDVEAYFHGLAQKFGDNDSAKDRVIFTLAVFTYTKDQVMGLAQMGVAYKPAYVYAPEDLDVYGTALLAQGKADEAYQVYEKIGRDYSVPPNVQPAQAAPAIQEAQATSLFGMGTALDKEGKAAQSGQMFAQLKALYPWSPRLLEANFGIARSLVQQGKYDAASALLVPIVSSRSAPTSLRAHAFLVIGQIQESKGNIDAAIDSYLKTAAFYGSVSDAAAEGLWRGGQMLEKQAATLTEQSTPKKSDQMAKAVNAYKQIGETYSDSPYFQQSLDRLKALGQ